MADPEYNLVYEKWIPIVGKGKVSLVDVFSDFSIRDIAGNPIQKIALIKLFVAIAQASVRLEDEDDWSRLGSKGLAGKALEYLESNKSCFYLYGDHPFLQMPVLKGFPGTEVQNIYYDFLPDLASENDSILRQIQDAKELSDSDKALFIVQLMNYAPGGKRTSFIKPLTPGYSSKSKNANAGPSLGGSFGYLQTCLMGNYLAETVWLNYFTDEDIKGIDPSRILDVRPPWEKMPEGEDDSRARELRVSIYAWLVGLSRFVLLTDNGIIYTEGLQYPKVKEGYFEPFIATREKDNSAIYADTAKKPWRSLTALLQAAYESSPEYSCKLLRVFLGRTLRNIRIFSIWSGGLRLRATSGDQSVKQDDDYVESETYFYSEFMQSPDYQRLCNAMKQLESYSIALKKSIKAYAKAMNSSADSSKNGDTRYWMSVEPFAQQIINACQHNDADALDSLMRTASGFVIDIYDDVCPHETARQVVEWIKNRPAKGDRKLGKEQ